MPPNCPCWSPGLAFVLAFVFGAVAKRVNFCTMGAVTDVVTFGDWRRMRMWVLAIAVAIAGRGVLASLGLIDLSNAIYATITVGSILAFTSLIAGCVAAVRYQIWRLDRMA